MWSLEVRTTSAADTGERRGTAATRHVAPRSNRCSTRSHEPAMVQVVRALDVPEGIIVSVAWSSLIDEYLASCMRAEPPSSARPRRATLAATRLTPTNLRRTTCVFTSTRRQRDNKVTGLYEHRTTVPQAKLYRSWRCVARDLVLPLHDLGSYAQYAPLGVVMSRGRCLWY